MIVIKAPFIFDDMAIKQAFAWYVVEKRIIPAMQEAITPATFRAYWKRFVAKYKLTDEEFELELKSIISDLYIAYRVYRNEDREFVIDVRGSAKHFVRKNEMHLDEIIQVMEYGQGSTETPPFMPLKQLLHNTRQTLYKIWAEFIHVNSMDVDNYLTAKLLEEI